MARALSPIVSVERKHFRRPFLRVNQEAGCDGPDRVEAIPERRHDPEVPATPSQSPEQIGVLMCISLDDLTVSLDHFGREEVVTSCAVQSHHVTQPAAEGETRNSGVRNLPASSGPAKGCRRAIKLFPRHPGLRRSDSFGRIDVDPFHWREVNHEPCVTDRTSGDIVTAAAHTDKEIPFTGQADRGPNIAVCGAPGNHGRLPVYHAVPNAACIVISGLPGTQVLIEVECHPLTSLTVRPICWRVNSRGVKKG